MFVSTVVEWLIQQTGASELDCVLALQEADGNIAQALEQLRLQQEVKRQRDVQ